MSGGFVTLYTNALITDASFVNTHDSLGQVTSGPYTGNYIYKTKTASTSIPNAGYISTYFGGNIPAVITYVDIGYGIQTIGASSFFAQIYLIEAIFPVTLTAIGEAAFKYTALININIPNTINPLSIDPYAFNSLQSVVGVTRTITIGNNVAYIGPQCFADIYNFIFVMYSLNTALDNDIFAFSILESFYVVDTPVGVTNTIVDYRNTYFSLVPMYYLPNKPTNVTLLRSGSNLNGYWTAPTLTNASAITGYIVSLYKSTDDVTYHFVNNVNTTSTTSTTCTISPLEQGPYYKIQVAAVNAAGNGLVSDFSSAVLLPVPAAPAAPTASVSGTTITINWQSVTGATGYLVYANGNLIVTDMTNTLTSITYTGTPNATYAFTVSASNNAGSSPQSSATTVTLPPAAPAAPTASVSGTTITINWQLVTGATSYSVYANGIPTPFLETTSTSTTYTAGTPGSTYAFTVTANNNAGSSPQSSASNIVTLPPLPPSNFTGTINATGILLNWASPPGNVDGYTITIQNNNTNSTQNVSLQNVNSWTYISNLTELTQGYTWDISIVSIYQSLTSSPTSITVGGVSTTIDTNVALSGQVFTCGTVKPKWNNALDIMQLSTENNTVAVGVSGVDGATGATFTSVPVGSVTLSGYRSSGSTLTKVAETTTRVRGDVTMYLANPSSNVANAGTVTTSNGTNYRNMGAISGTTFNTQTDSKSQVLTPGSWLAPLDGNTVVQVFESEVPSKNNLPAKDRLNGDAGLFGTQGYLVGVDMKATVDQGTVLSSVPDSLLTTEYKDVFKNVTSLRDLSLTLAGRNAEAALQASGATNEVANNTRVNRRFALLTGLTVGKQLKGYMQVLNSDNVQLAVTSDSPVSSQEMSGLGFWTNTDLGSVQNLLNNGWSVPEIVSQGQYTLADWAAAWDNDRLPEEQPFRVKDLYDTGTGSIATVTSVVAMNGRTAINSRIAIADVDVSAQNNLVESLTVGAFLPNGNLKWRTFTSVNGVVGRQW